MHCNAMIIPVLTLAAVFFAAGSRLQRRTGPSRARNWSLVTLLALAIPGLLMDLYYLHILDNASWFYAMRAMPWSELSLAGLGLLAGFVHAGREPVSAGEKAVVPVALAVMLLIPFLKPIVDPLDLDQLQDRCTDGVCLQSTFSTCGPASAATLLRGMGRGASERELARECFTSRSGTEIWYLMRALRRRGFEVRVEIQQPERLAPPTPSIAGVRVPGGAGHFIAIVSQSHGQVTIVDPLKGRMVIPQTALANAYRFTGFFLAVYPRG